MNALWTKTLWLTKVTWRLLAKDLIQNMAVYLFPLIPLIPIWLYLQKNLHPLALSAKLSLVVLIAAFVLAIIYGLQSFAGETDRKTLDFILSRPVPPLLLVLTKFFLNLGIYFTWFYLYMISLHYDWSMLHLPEGTSEWIFLCLLMILGMGFFSGLIVRGAERLIVTVGLTILLAGASYLIWNQAFLLMSASNYWFDISPRVVSLVSFWLPLTLLFASLITPMVFALWFLRGRFSLLRFKPFHRLVKLWLVIAVSVGLASTFFGPAVWPITPDNPHGGDWHPHSGIVVAGSYFKQRYPSKSLYLASWGGKAHAIYTGTQVHSPRWSPDGKSIAFVDGPWIKVYLGSIFKTLVKGDFPTWSQDGKSLVFCRKPNKHGYYDGVYQISLANRKIKRLLSLKLRIHGLAWDSAKNRIFLLHEEKTKSGKIDMYDIVAQKSVSAPIPTEVVLYMQNPSLTLISNGSLLAGFTIDHDVQIYSYRPDTNEFIKIDESIGHQIDVSSQTILSSNGQGYLIPRLGGGYDYKGLIPPHKHHPGDEDEHEH